MYRGEYMPDIAPNKPKGEPAKDTVVDPVLTPEEAGAVLERTGSEPDASKSTNETPEERAWRLRRENAQISKEKAERIRQIDDWEFAQAIENHAQLTIDPYEFLEERHDQEESQLDALDKETDFIDLAEDLDRGDIGSTLEYLDNFHRVRGERADFLSKQLADMENKVREQIATDKRRLQSGLEIKRLLVKQRGKIDESHEKLSGEKRATIRNEIRQREDLLGMWDRIKENLELAEEEYFASKAISDPGESRGVQERSKSLLAKERADIEKWNIPPLWQNLRNNIQKMKWEQRRAEAIAKNIKPLEKREPGKPPTPTPKRLMQHEWERQRQMEEFRSRSSAA